MAKPHISKRDVDKAKKERAAEKRERRQRPAGDTQVDATVPKAAVPAISEQEVLARLDELHGRFEAEAIEFLEYEALKGELIALLSSD